MAYPHLIGNSFYPTTTLDYVCLTCPQMVDLRKSSRNRLGVSLVIDVRRLRMLEALARYGTVRATADALHMSPSAVSQQISILEQESGVILVEKEGRNVRLTPGAWLLVEHSHAIFSELESARVNLEAYQQGDHALTRVGAFASAIPGFLGPAIARLRHGRPQWHFRIVQDEPETSIDHLINGDLDLVITMSCRHLPVSDHSQVRLEPLLTEPYDAVLRDDDPLCAEHDLDFAKHLEDQDWIMSAPGTAWHDCAVAAANQVGFQPKVLHTVDDFAAAIGLVRAGLGMAVLPRLGWSSSHRSGVSVRTLRSGPRRKVFAAIRRGDRSPALVETLREEGARLVPAPGENPLSMSCDEVG